MKISFAHSGTIIAALALASIPSVQADFQLFKLGATSLPVGIPARCRAALTTTIKCSLNLLRAVNGGLDSWTDSQLDNLCSATCGASIKSYVDNVHKSCPANTPLNNAPDPALDLYFYGDQNLWRFNVTCMKNSAGRYCQSVLLANQSDGVNCDPCYFLTQQMTLNSQFGQPDFGDPSTFADDKKACKIGNDKYPLTYTAGAPSATGSPTGSPSSGSPAPTGSSGPIVRCDPSDAKYTAAKTDTCASISKAKSVSTDELVIINGLDANCTYLTAGQKLCMPQPCKIYQVQKNDTCESIIKSEGKKFTQAQLVSWNLGLTNSCSNLPLKVGNSICVTPPGVKELPDKTPVKAPKPSNALAGSTDTCAKWQTLKAGDSCKWIGEEFSISQKDFTFLNPGVRTDCSNLIAGTAYCVAPVGNIKSYPNWSRIQFPSDIMTGSIDLSATSIVNATKTYIWPNQTNPIKIITETDVRVPMPSGWANYTGCPDFDFMENGELPDFALKNEAWMKVFSSYCLIDAGAPLPTGTPVWPPLDIPLEPVEPPTGTNEGAPKDCLKWYVTKAGDDCQSVSDKNNITFKQFQAMNPWIDDDCRNIWLDTAYCVDEIKFHSKSSQAPIPTTAESSPKPTTPPKTTPATPRSTAKPGSSSASPGSSSGGNAPTGTGVKPPGPTASGTVKVCQKWHVFKQGETCARVMGMEKIHLPEFRELNPAIDATCSNLVVGNAYCVQA